MGGLSEKDRQRGMGFFSELRDQLAREQVERNAAGNADRIRKARALEHKQEIIRLMKEHARIARQRLEESHLPALSQKFCEIISSDAQFQIWQSEEHGKSGIEIKWPDLTTGYRYKKIRPYKLIAIVCDARGDISIKVSDGGGEEDYNTMPYRDVTSVELQNDERRAESILTYAYSNAKTNYEGAHHNEHHNG